MIRREIEIDPSTDQALGRLAENYGGDLGQALADLLRTHEGLESFLDEIEQSHADMLREQLQTSKEQIEQGRTVSWDQVKRRNRL